MELRGRLIISNGQEGGEASSYGLRVSRMTHGQLKARHPSLLGCLPKTDEFGLVWGLKGKSWAG